MYGLEGRPTALLAMPTPRSSPGLPRAPRRAYPALLAGLPHAPRRAYPYAAIGVPSYFTPAGLTHRTRQATPCVEESKLQYPSALVVTVRSVVYLRARLLRLIRIVALVEPSVGRIRPHNAYPWPALVTVSGTGQLEYSGLGLPATVSRPV